MKYELRITKDPNIVQITTVDERWYQKKDTMLFFPSVTWITNSVPKDYGFLLALGTKGWDEMQRLKEEKGEKGGRVHNAIERLLINGTIELDDHLPDADGNEKELSAEEWEAVMSFAAWMEELRDSCNGDLELLGLETVGINEEHHFAGTRDIRLRVGEQTWTIDLKTSPAIYLSHIVQLSAYGQFPDALEDKLAILQVGYGKNKKGYKFTAIEPRFDLFLAAMTFWREKNEEATPYQRDYPRRLELLLSRAEGVPVGVVLGKNTDDDILDTAGF